MHRQLTIFTCQFSLSWCDTAASTFGRLYGKYTWPLPRKLVGLPLAPRKSFAGFAAAVLTGAVVAIGFWGWAVPAWQGYSVEAADTWGAVSWKWDEQPGVGAISGGWTSLALVGAVTGLVSGVAEALGKKRVPLLVVCHNALTGLPRSFTRRPWQNRRQLVLTHHQRNRTLGTFQACKFLYGQWILSNN